MQPMVARNRYSNGLELADAFDASDVSTTSLWGDDLMPAPRIYTTAEACRMLFCDRTTLHRWTAGHPELQPVTDPADKRIAGYVRRQLQQIADVHHIRLGVLPDQPEPSRRMRELERTVELLEARLARLEAHHPAVLGEMGQLPLPAQNRPTASHTPRLPKLPEGAVTFRRLIADYQADERTVRKWIAGGELPAPTRGGPWYAGTTVERIYTAEQIPAARAALERLTGQATGD